MAAADNVATALVELARGEIVDVEGHGPVTIAKTIEMGHKFALSPIKKGERVVKYGEVIGTAKRDIMPGDWVHSNIRSPYIGGSKDDG